MKKLTEKEYSKQLEKIKLSNEFKKRNHELKQEKNKYKSKPKLPSTSKLMAFYLFLMLNVILIYAMVAMWHFMDLSYLGILVTDVVGQVLTYFIYALKSTKENTKDGVVYETAMLEAKAKYENINSVEEVELGTPNSSIG